MVQGHWLRYKLASVSGDNLPVYFESFKIPFLVFAPKIPKEPYEPLLMRHSPAIHYSNKNMETRSNWWNTAQEIR